MLKFTFPIFKAPYYATIRDRPRNSGLTSVRFLTANLLVVCDFNERKCYLVELLDGPEITLLDQHPTLVSGDHPVPTDLLDVRGNEFVVTNFFQGSISFYAVENKKIKFLQELNLNSFKGAHGVRYVPGYDNLVWVSYCGKNNKCFQIVDYVNKKVLWTVSTEEQAQDVAFVENGKYALLAARTAHITEGILTSEPDVPLKDMYASAYLFEMPADLHASPPVLVNSWRGTGHIDACKEFGGYVFAANQYEDAINVFCVEDRKIVLKEKIDGFNMPHGLDIRSDGLLVTTNYGDQSLRLGFLPENLR